LHQDYVRARISQFGPALVHMINPSIAEQTAHQLTAELIASLPPPEYPNAPPELREYQLVFRHDCL
jgi:hypothetical protein